jgi:ribosomal protein S18 acetylase RimI-like enzyme
MVLKFLISDFEIKKLAKKDLNNFNFDCGIADLNEFLRDDALLQQEQKVNITYLWILKKSKKIAGYVTISCDSIHLSGQKKEEMQKIGISYRALPALKIGRMAVDNNYFKNGLGTLMIWFAIEIVKQLNNFSGCRFLTLESKNDSSIPDSKKPIHFYKKLGFVTTKERKKTAYIPLYRDLFVILNSIKK